MEAILIMSFRCERPQTILAKLRVPEYGLSYWPGSGKVSLVASRSCDEA